MPQMTAARGLLLLALPWFLGGLVAYSLGHTAPSGILCAVGVAFLGTSCANSERFRGFSFSLWVLVFLLSSLSYPEAFHRWGDFELQRLITPLIQLIMFGMGTMLSLADFARVLKMPRAVVVGMVLQFSVMPLVGAGLARAFGFPPEVAAGLVLVGSCPGGVASNLMTYLARGNIALSVTMTACSTLVSPLMTPLMMTWLAGSYIRIPFWDMMLTIVRFIIVPIVAGLIANWVLRRLNLRGPWLDRLLSWIAMGSICVIVGIITSMSRDQLLQVGLALMLAAVLHNLAGYLFGYGGAWLCGLDEATRRTVAIEVGLQNGGMASGLAVSVLKSSDAALAPAIFGPWMNVSGSILASWWRTRIPATWPAADGGTDASLERPQVTGSATDSR
jgi:bile acid:Na+ symporter, BASS family